MVSDSLEFDISSVRNAKTGIVPYLDDYKRYVVANYCQKHHYDLMINPLFQISTNADGNKMKVVVSGHPAKYKSFRQATENDQWMSWYMRDYKTNDRY